MGTDIDIAAALKAAQALIYDGRFDDARETLEPVIATEPGHIDALYMDAVCLRYLRRFDEAQDRHRALKKVAPSFGRGLQEEGHLFRAMGRDNEALSAFDRAVATNPALHGSWSALAELQRAAGEAVSAARSAAQAERLKALPKELLAAQNHLYENRLLKAESLCRSYLQAHPKDVDGMRILAEIGSRLGVLEDAEFLLESAVAFEPDDIEARIDYIRILRKRQKFEKAKVQAEWLHRRDPANPVFASQLAIEHLQTGNTDESLALFDQVLDAVPGDPATLTSRGHALKTVGRSVEAIECYRAAYQSKPDHGEAYYSLANLKTYSFSDEEFRRLTELTRNEALGLSDRIYLQFALAKAYEDRSDYDLAFEAYRAGNDLKRFETRYTSEQMEDEFAAQKEFCTEELFTRQGGMGDPAPDPIFIVGLPRAGSTLLEQILASHSQVDGTRELPLVLALSQKLRGRRKLVDKTRYPRVLHELTEDQLKELGRKYLDDAAIHREGAPYFTDKMPNNFRHIGLISLILPNAKIIDARREPMACCFSGFKQLFAEGQEFTYGLEEIGRYYRGYVDLMRHWDQVLPGKILRVQHEDVITDTDAQIRRLLDFCGLPFEEACLEFHKTERSVRTASSEQVRQPIFTSGMDQWRHFERHLAPLKDALGPALEEYRA